MSACASTYHLLSSTRGVCMAAHVSFHSFLKCVCVCEPTEGTAKLDGRDTPRQVKSYQRQSIHETPPSRRKDNHSAVSRQGPWCYRVRASGK